MTTNAAIPQEKVFTKKDDEKILVVRRENLFPLHAPQGLMVTDIETYASLIEKRKEYRWRSQMEQDPTFKQIIPYIVFSHEERYFVMQRKATAGDARLKNKLSLGIGGHIREDDMASGSLFDWAQREFQEEVSFSGLYNIKPVGLINDETNAVGQVHTGFLFMLQGDSSEIAIKDEHAAGYMWPLKECKKNYDLFESWSQLILDHLLGQQENMFMPAKAMPFDTSFVEPSQDDENNL
jgi:predicted NUDIX family phosphoesterase